MKSIFNPLPKPKIESFKLASWLLTGVSCPALLVYSWEPNIGMGPACGLSLGVSLFGLKTLKYFNTREQNRPSINPMILIPKNLEDVFQAVGINPAIELLTKRHPNFVEDRQAATINGKLLLSLDFFENPCLEQSSIVAHESSHLLHRDSENLFTPISISQSILSRNNEFLCAGLILGKVHWQAFITVYALSRIYMMLQAQLRQQAEYRCDREAIQLTQKDTLIHVMEKSFENNPQPPPIYHLTANHPPLQKRIKACRSYYEKLLKPEGFTILQEKEDSNKSQLKL